MTKTVLRYKITSHTLESNPLPLVNKILTRNRFAGCSGVASAVGVLDSVRFFLFNACPIENKEYCV